MGSILSGINKETVAFVIGGCSLIVASAQFFTSYDFLFL